MIGEKFGRLTVLRQVDKPEHIKKNDKYFLCRCECGREKIVNGYNLRRGLTTSCGCYAKEQVKKYRNSTKNTPTGARVNLLGQVFGKLTVIAKADNVHKSLKNPVGTTAWLCRCECGVAEVKTGTALKKPSTVSMCSTCRNVITTQRLLAYQSTQEHGVRFINYAGRRYGRLLVLARYPENIKGRTTYIVVCDCGTFKLVSREGLDNGHTNSCGCYRREDSREKMLVIKATQTGPNNPAWNAELSDEDRVDRRTLDHIKKWAADVKCRDDFTCQLCLDRGGKLHSHHLDSYREHPDRRADITNGVTLCVQCHKAFHAKYGQKVTYEWQYHEFKQNYVPAD